MKLVVGLGNPGIEYQFTPHNLGFLTVDRIADRAGVKVINRQCRALTAKANIGQEQVLLAKPETYMNLSGMAVRALVEEHEFQPADVVVVYDELAFPLGTLRIRERGSSGCHNGLESAIGALGTELFTRVRLGVGPGHKLSDGASYLLAPFKKSQYKAVDEILENAADAVEMIVKEGAAKAMNKFNQRAESAEQET